MIFQHTRVLLLASSIAPGYDVALPEDHGECASHAPPLPGRVAVAKALGAAAVTASITILVVTMQGRRTMMSTES